MAEPTATVAETRAHLSKMAADACVTGASPTAIGNSGPWAAVAPAGAGCMPAIDWSKGAVPVDPKLGYAVLPAEWDDADDDGLYDDLA